MPRIEPPKTHTKYEKVFERVADLAKARKLRDSSGVDLKFIDVFRRMRVDDGAAPKMHYTETIVVRQLVNFALSRDMIATDPLKGLKLKNQSRRNSRAGPTTRSQ